MPAATTIIQQEKGAIIIRVLKCGLSFMFLCMAATAYAADAAPNACSVFSEGDALKAVGGPLGEVIKSEVKPSPSNRNNHQTACGYFPKGFNMATASAPPERGITVTLNALCIAEDAKTYYEGLLDMAKEMSQSKAGPHAGTKIAPVSGLGEGAYLKSVNMDNYAGKILILTALKGRVVTAVQVWKNDPAIDNVARAVGAQVLGKLP